MFSTPAMLETVSDRAWLQALLDTEAALARACERAGVIPIGSAEVIASYCKADRFDIDEVGAAAVAAGVPVVPLVEALRAAAPTDAAPYVHFGATSQDILDTAMMLIVRRALDLIVGEVAAAADAAAVLSERHRLTVMAGRTLLQQAVPITFGLKAAGWLNGILEAHSNLRRVRGERLAAQLGGAAGTLAAFGPSGLDVARFFAEELDLREPSLPWHTSRGRIAEIASACAMAAGAAGKVALDVMLLMQSEVAEVFERDAPGRGRSSAMPQKRNPVLSIEVAASVPRINALVGVLLGAMVQAHERAAGEWQSEWESVSELLALTGGAVSRLRELIEGLEVDAVRMGANLDASGGFAMAETVVTALSGTLDPTEARSILDGICRDALEAHISLRRALIEHPRARQHLSEPQIDELLDPTNAIGLAPQLVDRTLAAYRAFSPSPVLPGKDREANLARRQSER